MIKPSIGRVVLFHPSKNSGLVFPALVCFVHSDALINVGGFDNNGNAFGATSVPLLQDGDEVPDFGAYATWMPYQVGEDKKIKELQKQVDAALGTAKETMASSEELSKPCPALTPGVSGSAGMEALPKILDSAVIDPVEVDELMADSTEGPGPAPMPTDKDSE